MRKSFIVEMLNGEKLRLNIEIPNHDFYLRSRLNEEGRLSNSIGVRVKSGKDETIMNFDLLKTDDTTVVNIIEDGKNK